LNISIQRTEFFRKELRPKKQNSLTRNLSNSFISTIRNSLFFTGPKSTKNSFITKMNVEDDLDVESELRDQLHSSNERIKNLELERESLLKSNTQLKGMLKKNKDVMEQFNIQSDKKNISKSIDVQTDNNEFLELKKKHNNVIEKHKKKISEIEISLKEKEQIIKETSESLRKEIER